MIAHLHWFTRDNDPITGRSAVQVRVHAPPGVVYDQRLVKAALVQFEAECRLSLADHMRKTYTMGDMRLVARSVFGQVSADLYLPGAEEEEPEFYGGILIQLQRVTDETYWSNLIYGRLPYFHGTTPLAPPEEICELIPEAATPGDGLGRPAVPGPLGDLEPTPEVPEPPPTDWLIVQVASDKAVDENAIATGAVKIFRIRDPKHGPIVAHNDDAKGYLVSANWSETTPLHEFYICGQQIDGVPPLIGVPGGVEVDPRLLRLYVFALSVPSFETANESAGIFILAERDNLWAVNTLAGDTDWALLDTTDDSGRNHYGTTFTETLDPSTGATIVSCSGSNAYGVCSGFSVTITPQPVGPPIITGEIQPMAMGGISPMVPQSSDFTTNQTVQANRWQSHMVVHPISGDFGWALSYAPNASVTQTYSYTADDYGTIIDDFMGGAMPSPAPLRIELTSSDQITCDRAPSFDPLAPSFENYTRVRSAHCVITGGPIPGWLEFEMTYANIFTDMVPGFSGGELQGGSEDIVATTSNTIGPVQDRHYIERDHHCGRLAIRHDHEVSGIWEVSNTVPGQVDVAMNSVSFMKASVLRSDAEVLVEHDLRTVFGGQLVSDEPQSWPRSGFEYRAGNALGLIPHPLTDMPRAHYGLFIPHMETKCFASWTGVYDNGPDPLLTAPYPGANLPKTRSAVTADLGEYSTAGEYDALWAQGEPIVDGTILSGDPLVMTKPTNYFPSAWGDAAFPWDPPRTREISHVVYRDLRSGGFLYQIFQGGMLDSTSEMKPLLDLSVGNDLGSTPLVPLINEWAKLGEADPEYERLLIRPETIAKVSLL